MAERRDPHYPRVIPNFAMDKPWTEPIAPEEEEALASSALIAGVPATNRAISDFMRQIDNQQYAQLLQVAASQGLVQQ